jgi:hypothetical protein
LIIALSALITEEIFAKCLDCGFDDVSKYFFVKLTPSFIVESPLNLE